MVIVSFISHYLQALRTLLFEAQEARKDSTTWNTKKATVRSAMYDNGVVGPYYYDNGTVGGVELYRIRDTYVQWEGQQLLQNAFSAWGTSSYHYKAAYILIMMKLKIHVMQALFL